jgi:hypothetical protein
MAQQSLPAYCAIRGRFAADGAPPIFKKAF